MGQNGTEQENKDVSSFLRGARILLPFAAALLTALGAWYDSRTQQALGDAERAALIERVSALEADVDAHKTIIPVIQNDLTYIKDGQQKNYDLLVRIANK